MSLERLTGTVERVTFHTEDTGYTVLKVKIAGRAEPVTVTGRAATIHAGEVIQAEGEWVNVAEWGRQFKAEQIQSSAPTSKEGIERFLASGLIDGIGPVYAKKLVDKFGAEIFDIIEQSSARLQEVPGVGEKRRREIKNSWERQKTIRKIMVFLHGHGISTGKAVKIFQAYGEQAVAVVEQSPWKLAEDITGIGFKTADGIAQRMGMPEDAPDRLRAGLFHVLLAAGNDGHCALPRAELVTKCMALLQVAPEPLEGAVDGMLENAELVRDVIGGQELLYPPHLARSEADVAQRLRFLAGQASRLPQIDADAALAEVQQRRGKQLAASQQEAVRAALTNRVLVITGGPGVGKTTILQAILDILVARDVRLVLAAPTGRAARRMASSTGQEAKTIHRLLDWDPAQSSFRYNSRNQLKGDLFVLDETSMVDTALMAYYLRALPDTAHLLLVGDVDQLPSVGPGTVLADIIRSGVVPVVRLTEVFRQAAESRIITAAHAINAGQMPETPKPAPPGCDFHFIERETPEAIVDTIVHLMRERIPNAFHLDPLRDIQVLCPMNRGLLGTANLNAVLQRALNPPHELKPEVDRYGLTFRVGDKVIQTRNNYEKDAFNGDIGHVTHIEAEPFKVSVAFEDNRTADYESGDLDELRPAYAITIHKSQGSEFPAVIIPVSTQHYVMLQRNLFYTAVTRGRKLVILTGDRRALEIAVKTAGGNKRWSGLCQRLTGG